MAHDQSTAAFAELRELKIRSRREIAAVEARGSKQQRAALQQRNSLLGKYGGDLQFDFAKSNSRLVPKWS